MPNRSRFSTTVQLGVAVGWLFAAACGGVTEADLFADAGAVDAAGPSDGSGSGTAAGSSSSGTGAVGSGGVTGSGSQDAAVSSTPDADTTPLDAGTPPPPPKKDAASGSDAGSGTGGGFDCFGTQCSASEDCCASMGGGAKCVPSGQCPAVTITCLTSAGCSGSDVCCLAFSMGGSGEASCTSASSCSDQQGFVLCDPSGSGNQCPDGESCNPGPTGVGGYCGNGFGGNGQ